jgi:tRNA/rRNA methyltransferase
MLGPMSASAPHDPFADPTRFVLVRPSHAGNVGAAARAIRVMGFGRLVLVAPRDPRVLASVEARALASGATDVLDAASTVDDLPSALAGADFACATAMTPRDFGPPTAAPRDCLPGLAGRRARVAFVFGEERVGLANDDLYRCHQVLSIPTAPDYGSLNLAQSVQLLAYEWRQALGGFPVVPRAPDDRRADGVAVQGLLAHWGRVLEQIGFLDPASPKKLIPRLQRLLNRARPTEVEVHILRGIARSIEEARAPAAAHDAQPLATLDRPPPDGT